MYRGDGLREEQDLLLQGLHQGRQVQPADQTVCGEQQSLEQLRGHGLLRDVPLLQLLGQEIEPGFALIGRDPSILCSDWLDHDVANASSQKASMHRITVSARS